MGFFSKIKEAFSKKIYEVFTAKELNDEFFEELEYVLISSDLGAEATSQILENFKEECYNHKIKKPEDAKELLKQIMVDSIDYEIQVLQRIHHLILLL